MARNLPRELASLLESTDPSAIEQAWSAFLKRYNRYLLGTSRFLSADYDGKMDRYRYVLEQLRRDDFRRLRSYAVDSRSRFSTWLVVVVRSLCRDYERKKYGRVRDTSGSASREALAVRRRLLDLIGDELDVSRVRDRLTETPERQLRKSELSQALEIALSELGTEDRLLLKLRYQDGLPVNKIARLLKLRSVFHVYRRLRSILSDLKNRLQEEGVHDPDP